MRCLIYFILLSFSSVAQYTEFNTNVKSTTIGTQFNIILSVKSSNTVQWKKHENKQFPAHTIENPIDSADIEIIESKILHSRKGWQEMEITLIPWDTGKVVFSGYSIVNGESNIIFPNDTIEVSTSLIEGVDSLIDIREKFVDTPNTKKENSSNYFWLNWIAGILGFGIISALLYWIWRRNVQKRKPGKILSPEEKAIEILNKIKKEKLWELNQKEYYDKLSFVLRQFITEELQISLLDKTTSEIAILLKKTSLNSSEISIIQNLLNSADLVKFAASTSSHEFAQEKLNDCFNIIGIISKRNENVE